MDDYVSLSDLAITEKKWLHELCEAMTGQNMTREEVIDFGESIKDSLTLQIKPFGFNSPML